MRRRVVAVALAALGAFGTHAAAQETTDPLLGVSRDKAFIAVQARAALPRAQRALELITTSMDPESLTLAVANADAAYRYLRMAQQNTEGLISVSKYPDPLLTIQKDRMWEVRRHFLQCMGDSSYIVEGNPTFVSKCTDNLTEAVRKLQALLAIML